MFHRGFIQNSIKKVSLTQSWPNARSPYFYEWAVGEVNTPERNVQSNLVRTNTDKANFPLVRTKVNPMVGQASILVKIIRLRRTSVQRTFAKTNYFQV